jgi:hypothetical protein
MAKGLVNPVDRSAAIKAANRLTDITAQGPGRPENEAIKFVNMRLKETDHKRIGALANNAGITKAAFCKAASLYIAEMVDAGAFIINAGGIIDRRG